MKRRRPLSVTRGGIGGTVWLTRHKVWRLGQAIAMFCKSPSSKATEISTVISSIINWDNGKSEANASELISEKADDVSNSGRLKTSSSCRLVWKLDMARASNSILKYHTLTTRSSTIKTAWRFLEEICWKNIDKAVRSPVPTARRTKLGKQSAWSVKSTCPSSCEFIVQLSDSRRGKMARCWKHRVSLNVPSRTVRRWNERYKSVTDSGDW